MESLDVMDPSLQAQDDSVDIAEYWQMLLGHKWFIIFITVCVACGALVYYSKLPNRYTAGTQILVEKPEGGSKTFEEVVMPSYRWEEDYYGTQVAILTGQNTSRIVGQELNLTTPYSINAKRLRGTRIILLSVTHNDPQTAAKIANKFAEVYIRESSHQQLFMSQQVLKWLPDETEILSPDAATTAPARIPDNIPEAKKKQYVESLSSVMNDPVVFRLRSEKLETEAQLKELLDRYKEEHPSVKQLKQRLEYIQQEMKDRTSKILTNLKASLEGDFAVTTMKVLEEAVPPRKPSEPNRVTGVVFFTLLGFFMSSSFVILSEFSNQRIRTEKDIPFSFKLPFLGYIPFSTEFQKTKRHRSKVVQKNISLVEAVSKNPALADAVANVRTHILFSMPYEKSKIVMLTSAIPNEGKTTVASLLAISLSSMGRKILLVDGDIRRPTLHTYLDLPNDKGLTDYLIGTISFEDAIRDIPNTTTRVVTGGRPSPNPTELLSSERFREFLDKALVEYDRIVIDVAPVLYIPDGLIVAKHVHSGVLVCGSGMVDKKAVKIVKDKFDSVGHSFIGVIINRADYAKEGYRYKYLYAYKSYYSGRKGEMPGV